nr:chromosome transmission fidelity protein 8 homolog [Parasteatoda tepidariorum]
MIELAVKLLSNDDSQALKEWAIIEVQGDLECNTGDTIGGKLIGHLFYSTKKQPLLVIGYQTLYGKVTEQKPPLAVLKRQRSPSVDLPTSSNTDQNINSKYEVLALVDKKIVFRARPKPIV